MELKGEFVAFVNLVIVECSVKGSNIGSGWVSGCDPFRFDKRKMDKCDVLYKLWVFLKQDIPNSRLSKLILYL